MSSSTTTTRGSIFILNHLPHNPNSRDGFPGDRSYRPYEDLAAAYNSALGQILSCPLNKAGLVRGIYVNFGSPGGYYYCLNPNAKHVSDRAFEAQLPALLEHGQITNPDKNDDIIWLSIPDISSLMSRIPPDSRKIGCVHGSSAVGKLTKKFRDYIKNAMTEQNYVFVVGKINQEIQTYIDDYIEVSGYDLEPHICISKVILEMEKKWGIH